MSVAAIRPDQACPRGRRVLSRADQVVDREALGDCPVGALPPSTIAAAVGTWSQTLAPGTVGRSPSAGATDPGRRRRRRARRVQRRQIGQGAHCVKAPTAPRRRDVHLSDEDVTTRLGTTPEFYRPPVVASAGSGMRISEACGLRVQDVDFLRRTVRGRQQRRPDGDMGRLRTESSSRDIATHDTVLAALAEHIRQRPRADGLSFSSTLGRPLTKSIAGHVFDDMERAVTFTVSPHSLRHHFGAGLISRGVSVVAVSRWLGRSSAEITYRVYAYLRPDDEAAGRSAMAKTMRKMIPGVHPTCTQEASQKQNRR